MMVGHENHLISVHTILYIRYFWFATDCHILRRLFKNTSSNIIWRPRDYWAWL